MPPARSSSASKLAPIYVVFGAETFLKREAVRDIMAQVLAGADPSLALSEYDGGGSVELAQVLDDLRTLPFLAPHRLVVIRDADTFITRYREELEDYCENLSDTGVLLLECKSFPSTTRLAKRVQSIGQAIKCESLSSRAIPGWLAERCRTAYGKRIDAAASAMLAEYIGEDLGLLDSELNKLTLYVGDRPAIAATDIQALVGHTREEQVWGILSAIAAGSEGKAMTLWEQVWETDRAAPGRAIAGIAYKVRQLLTAKRYQRIRLVVLVPVLPLLLQNKPAPQPTRTPLPLPRLPHNPSPNL